MMTTTILRILSLTLGLQMGLLIITKRLLTTHLPGTRKAYKFLRSLAKFLSLNLA